MIVAATKSNTGGRSIVSFLVERTAIKWMRQIFGFPEGNTVGLIASGTSMTIVTCGAKVIAEISNHGSALMNNVDSQLFYY